MDDLGKLIVRLTVAVLTAFHGVGELGQGLAPVKHAYVTHGIPEGLAATIYLGHLVGPALVILGLFTRLGAFLIALQAFIIILLVHLGELFLLTPNGGYKLELQTFYLFTAIAVTLFGAGRYSLGGRDGRWN
jgi:putative oxidoreductase